MPQLQRKRNGKRIYSEIFRLSFEGLTTGISFEDTEISTTEFKFPITTNGSFVEKAIQIIEENKTLKEKLFKISQENEIFQEAIQNMRNQFVEREIRINHKNLQF
jgi:predicted regulator of amino acid metabolism with ACT domain